MLTKEARRTNAKFRSSENKSCNPEFCLGYDAVGFPTAPDRFILKGYARDYKPKTRLNQLRDILKVSYPNRITAIRKKGINRMGDQMAFYSMNGFLDMAIFPDP